MERGVEDMLVMELACIAGAMEARGEISIPLWDDLSSAIADSVYEYYEGNSTGIKECSEIAIQTFRTRFRPAERGMLCWNVRR